MSVLVGLLAQLLRWLVGRVAGKRSTPEDRARIEGWSQLTTKETDMDTIKVIRNPEAKQQFRYNRRDEGNHEVTSPSESYVARRAALENIAEVQRPPYRVVLDNDLVVEVREGDDARELLGLGAADDDG